MVNKELKDGEPAANAAGDAEAKMGAADEAKRKAPKTPVTEIGRAHV